MVESMSDVSFTCESQKAELQTVLKKENSHFVNAEGYRSVTKGKEGNEKESKFEKARQGVFIKAPSTVPHSHGYRPDQSVSHKIRFFSSLRYR